MSLHHKHGDCLNMAENWDDFYIMGHGLTEDEIWQAIADHNEERNGEFYAEADAGMLREFYKIHLKREEWNRWGLCTCGDDHERDLYEAKPHARGAFRVTYVIIKVRESVVSRNSGIQKDVK